MPPATTMRAVLLQLGAVGPSRLLRSQRAALAGGRYGWLALQPARLERAAAAAAAAERRWARPLRTATAANSAAPAPAADAASSGKRPPHKQLQPARERKHYSCPACGQHCYRAEVLQRHLFKCCPDIVRLEEWELAATDDSSLRGLLDAIAVREEEQRERSLELTFRQRDSSGERIRQDLEAVAAAMGVPLARAQRLLQFAMRAVPLAADPHPVEVLYEDADLLAVNKPPGVITAPKHRYVGGSIVNRVKGTLGFEPLTLHRLDMNTSGVVLFAKTRDVVPGLHAQFRNKEVRKEYLALTVGVPREECFTVDAPIDRDDREKIARRVAPSGKPAVTNFRVLCSSQEADLALGTPAALAAIPQDPPPRGASLVQCEPLTGRTHQIRVHLAHRGHPILGDDVYGLVGPWLARQALHAAALTVAHPRSGAPLCIRAPLPQDMQRALAMLRLPDP